MAWETVLLKVPELAHAPFGHKHPLVCPKCAGKLYGDPAETTAPEMLFLVLNCDRCGQQIAFESCSGDCADMLRPQCEVCGRYYCAHCGIHEDFEVDGKPVSLRFCNDHVPEWYRNR